jgi:hypothetical protein
MPTKEELQAIADAHGVDYKASDTKAKLEQRLDAAGHLPPDEGDAPDELTSDRIAKEVVSPKYEDTAKVMHTSGTDTTSGQTVEEAAKGPKTADDEDQPVGDEVNPAESSAAPPVHRPTVGRDIVQERSDVEAQRVGAQSLQRDAKREPTQAEKEDLSDIPTEDLVGIIETANRILAARGEQDTKLDLERKPTLLEQVKELPVRENHGIKGLDQEKAAKHADVDPDDVIGYSVRQRTDADGNGVGKAAVVVIDKNGGKHPAWVE